MMLASGVGKGARAKPARADAHSEESISNGRTKASAERGDVDPPPTSRPTEFVGRKGESVRRRPARGEIAAWEGERI